jgi:hypothetical protein
VKTDGVSDTSSDTMNGAGRRSRENTFLILDRLENDAGILGQNNSADERIDDRISNVNDTEVDGKRNVECVRRSPGVLAKRGSQRHKVCHFSEGEERIGDRVQRDCKSIAMQREVADLKDFQVAKQSLRLQRIGKKKEKERKLNGKICAYIVRCN